jgi:signal transduction histidine kinase
LRTTTHTRSTPRWTPTTAQWIALDVAFWTAIALLYGAQWTLRNGVRDPNALARLVVTQLVSFAPCMVLAPLVVLVANRRPIGRGRLRETLAVHAVALVAFVVVAGASMGALEWALPWERSTRSLLASAGAGIYLYVAPDVLFYLLVAAAANGALHARESHDRAIDQAQLRAQLAEAELSLLSMQLQPHFLFNSLHAISALVRYDPPHAERLIARLSELLRYSLRPRATVTLDEELGMLGRYVEIQRARYGDRLDVAFSAEPRVSDLQVPPLMLQPLVENAIRHGIAPNPDGGLIEIAAWGEDGIVHITVEDDGIGLPSDGVHDGIGLSATRARLRTLYGDACALRITARPGGGTVCRISIRAADAGLSPDATSIVAPDDWAMVAEAASMAR